MFKGVKLQWKLDWFDFNLMWPKFNKNLVMPNLEMQYYMCIISNCKAKIQEIVLQLCLTCVLCQCQIFRSFPISMNNFPTCVEPVTTAQAPYLSFRFGVETKDTSQGRVKV